MGSIFDSNGMGQFDPDGYSKTFDAQFTVDEYGVTTGMVVIQRTHPVQQAQENMGA